MSKGACAAEFRTVRPGTAKCPELKMGQGTGEDAQWEFYCAMKKDTIMQFTAAWMELEEIV